MARRTIEIILFSEISNMFLTTSSVRDARVPKDHTRLSVSARTVGEVIVVWARLFVPASSAVGRLALVASADCVFTVPSPVGIIVERAVELARNSRKESRRPSIPGDCVALVMRDSG